LKNAFDLEKYLSRGVEQLVSDALKATLKRPKQSLFLAQYALSAKKAAVIRDGYANKGGHIPPFLIASITSSCNLHCAGCYARAGKTCTDTAQEGLLTAPEWDAIFTQAEKLGICFVLLAGGEPTLRRDVLSKAASHRSIIFPVFTNGTLMDGEILTLFDKNHNLLPILSIEGDEEYTDSRRGKGVYALLMRSMRELSDRDILYGVSITVTRENMGRVACDSYLEDLRRAGCKVVFYVEYVPSDPKANALAPGDEERDFLEKRLLLLRERSDDMIYISFPGDEKLSGGCLAAGRGFFHINPKGGAEPCPFSPFSDTSLKDVSLLEALSSPLFRRLREGDILMQEHMGGCVLFEQEQTVRNFLTQSAK